MILTNKFFDTFDNVFDVFHKADFYGSNFASTGDLKNLELALPGFSKKDINIEIDGLALTVSAEVDEDKSTRYYKSFSKSYVLPTNTNVENISAKMTNGLLIIDFGGKTESKSITIK